MVRGPREQLEVAEQQRRREGDGERHAAGQETGVRLRALHSQGQLRGCSGVDGQGLAPTRARGVIAHEHIGHAVDAREEDQVLHGAGPVGRRRTRERVGAAPRVDERALHQQWHRRRAEAGQRARGEHSGREQQEAVERQLMHLVVRWW